MNTCWSSRGALAAYHDGALSERKARKLERHLRTCPRCQNELVELRLVTGLLHAMPEPTRPEGYWQVALERVRRNIQARSHPSRRSLLEQLRGFSQSPAQALLPAMLLGVALINALLILGLEEETFTFLTSYLLPLVLE